MASDTLARKQNLTSHYPEDKDVLTSNGETTMIRHFISMILACLALLGFIYITKGNWEAIDWLIVFINYGSIIPLCVWTTWIVMTAREANKAAKVDSLKY